LSDERSLLRDPRLIVARRDIVSLKREKTIVLALLIQLFVAAFSSFLVVGLTSLYSPGSVAAGEIVVGVSGEHQDALIDAAEDIESVQPVRFDDVGEARQSYRDGQLHALVIAADANGRIGAEVVVPDGGIQTTLVVDRVRDLLADETDA
jgi:hypothetical protein